MSISVCKFYNQYKKCSFGKHCRYLHSASSDRPPGLIDLSEEFDKEHQQDPSHSLATLVLSETFNSSNSDQNEGTLSSSVQASDIVAHQQLVENSQGEHAVQLNKNLSKPVNKTICNYFAKYGSCRYEKECRFFHSSEFLSDKDNGSHTRQRSLGKNTEIPPRFRTGGWNTEITTACTKTHSDENIRSRYGINQRYIQSSEQPQRNGRRKANYSHRKVCLFFKSGHCNRGVYCQFIHPSEFFAKEKAASQPVQHGLNDEQADGREGNSAETASLDETPDQDRANRSVCQPWLKKQIFTYAELESLGIMKVRDSEINTIKKRFPRDKITLLEETESAFSARILFSPTDPDWTFDISEFQLIVNLPSSYPREMMNVILPVDQNLPETVRRYVEISIREWLDHKMEQLAAVGKVELVFRPFLLWLDRNIEDITMEALKQLKRELVARAAGMEFIPAEKLQAKFRAQSEFSAEVEDNVHFKLDGADKLTSSESEDDSDADLDDSEVIPPQNIDPEKKGTEIELRHLQLRESASALIFEKLKLVLQCGRCKNHSDLLLTPGKVMSLKCEKCCQNQFVHFRAALIHQFSSVAGYLDVDGCQAFDLIFQDCRVAVTCLSCSKQTHINGLVAGHMVDGWCQSCNAHFKLATEAVKFVQLVPSIIDTSVNKIVEVASSKQKRPPKDPAIKEGCPLPGFGTCKHYKQSYRWLRFPCCGKAYPCGICHDKKEDHEMVFATRMICGHCCKEQNFSATRPCSGCSQHLTKTKTAHWEGGGGCRDKITMSRNDQQKYKNMNKTQSSHKKKVHTGASKKITKLRHA